MLDFKSKITARELAEFRQDIFYCKIEFCKKFLQKNPELGFKVFGGAGESALHMAVSSSNCTPELIDLLLDFGAEINLKRHDSKSPLAIGAGKKQSFEIFEHLVKRGADLLGKTPGDQSQMSILHLATLNDQNDMVRLLVDRGGIDLIEDSGQLLRRPLHSAVLAGNARACQILLSAGADPHALDAYGNSAVAIASEKEHQRIALMLISFGANAEETRLWKTFTMEMAAAASGQTERLLDLHSMRKSTGQPITEAEMNKIIWAASVQRQDEAVSLLQSLNASDRIEDVLRESSLKMVVKNSGP